MGHKAFSFISGAFKHARVFGGVEVEIQDEVALRASQIMFAAGSARVMTPFGAAVRRNRWAGQNEAPGAANAGHSGRCYANAEVAVGMHTRERGRSSGGGCDPGASIRILHVVGNGRICTNSHP